MSAQTIDVESRDSLLQGFLIPLAFDLFLHQAKFKFCCSVLLLYLILSFKEQTRVLITVDAMPHCAIVLCVTRDHVISGFIGATNNDGNRTQIGRSVRQQRRGLKRRKPQSRWSCEKISCKKSSATDRNPLTAVATLKPICRELSLHWKTLPSPGGHTWHNP